MRESPVRSDFMANNESDPKPLSLGGFNQALNLSFVRANENEVVAELTITPEHHQPMGIVHGGVYCAMVETVCSVGGYLASVAMTGSRADSPASTAGSRADAPAS